MGNTNTIESNLTRLADALERLAAAQTRIREICEHVHLNYPVPGAATSAPAPVSEAPDVKEETVAAVETAIQESSVAVTPTPEAHQWTYETLKAALLGRGVEIAPRTKMTTLLKLWELHKDDAPVPAEPEAPAPAAEVEVIPAEPEAPAPAPAAEVEVDLFGEVVVEEPASVEVVPMTAAEARDYFVKSGYTGTPEQRVWMRAAVTAVGRSNFNECVEGDFEKVIAEYERLAKEAK
jgi:hypothetical protein